MLDIPHDSSKPLRLQLDAEWLAILKSTNHFLNLTSSKTYLGNMGERYARLNIARVHGGIIYYSNARVSHNSYLIVIYLSTEQLQKRPVLQQLLSLQICNDVAHYDVT